MNLTHKMGLFVIYQRRFASFCALLRPYTTFLRLFVPFCSFIASVFAGIACAFPVSHKL